MYLKTNLKPDHGIPGPGNYDTEQRTGSTKAKYTMQGRTTNHLLLTSVRHNPGPGQYDPKTDTNKLGVFYVSKLKNSMAPSFSLPSLKRFQYNDKHVKIVPGPGAYDPKT